MSERPDFADLEVDPRAIVGAIAQVLGRQAELGSRAIERPVAQRIHVASKALIRGDKSLANPAQARAVDPRAALQSARDALQGGAAPTRPTPPSSPPLSPAQSSAAPHAPSTPSAASAPARSQPGEHRAPVRPPAGERPVWAPQPRHTAPTGLGSPALDAIWKDLDGCQRCALHQRRANIVFGDGNPNARLMFIGEGAGADEDRQGTPFVGPAGQLLTRMIGAMGFARNEVYIANVVKCRPPGNRNPEPEEIAACLPFLERQVQAVQPEAIVVLGAVAASALLNRKVAITRERGSWQQVWGIPAMITYHPAYLLRQESAKRDAWADLQAVMARLGIAPKR